MWRSASGGDRSWTLSRDLLPFAQGIPSHDRLNQAERCDECTRWRVVFGGFRGLAEEAALYFDKPGQRATAPFETTVADHGRIESRLHWVMDVVFHDELIRLRTGNGPRNMSTIKHMAMNLIRNAGG